MKTRATMLLLISPILSLPLLAATDEPVRAGDPAALVNERYGAPNAEVEFKGRRVLSYPGGLIEIENDKVAALRGRPETLARRAASPTELEKAMIQKGVKGDRAAQFKTAGNFMWGRGGLPLDPEQAVWWLRQAAEQGDHRAGASWTRGAARRNRDGR